MSLLSHQFDVPDKGADAMVDAELGGGDIVKSPQVELSFQDLRFGVKGPKGSRIEILKGISGQCRPGRVLAIMGSSGAGKTTLLDMLAGAARGRSSGAILANGQPIQWSSFRRQACYVLQRDVLLSSSTVRESIMLSALLKLPHDMPYSQKIARVDTIIEQLELTGCQHTLIGDEEQGMKGISGGQKRRVSVGIELIKDPSVIFLDEPTSGLDSEMAVGVMSLLLRLAHEGGKTVVITIHQPNSLITAQFDDFMLLADGHCVYGGPWAGALPHFAAAGFSCPTYTNPTDYFLSVLKKPEDKELLIEFGRKQLTVGCEEGAPGPAAEEQGAEDAEPPSAAPEARWATQVWLLSKRMVLMWRRSPNMLFSELSQYLFLALFIGLMYLQLNDSVASGLPDRLASLWFALAILSFTPSYTAITIWDPDRKLLRRESSQGMYSIPAWFVARTLTVTPIQIAQTIIFGAISYWMVGYVANAGSFFIYLLAFALFQLVSETIGMLCAICSRNATYAVLILTFVLLIMLSFSGFLVTRIPVYFKWISKISYLTYTYAAVVANEFDHVTFETAQGESVPGSTVIPSQTDNGLSIAVNLVILFCIYIITRLGALAALMGAARLRWL